MKRLRNLFIGAIGTACCTMCTALTSYAELKFNNIAINVTLRQTDAVKNEYSLLPANIRDRFERENNYVSFFDGYNEDYKGLLGVYAGKEGKGCIILTNTDLDGADSLLHEIGHFVDDCACTDTGTEIKYLTHNGAKVAYAKGGTRSISESDDFHQIWIEECDNNPLITNYESDDQCEYFAGSFAAYIHNPVALLRHAPKTYCFIKAVVDKI